MRMRASVCMYDYHIAVVINASTKNKSFETGDVYANIYCACAYFSLASVGIRSKRVRILN